MRGRQVGNGTDLWSKDILRIARRVQQNTHRLLLPVGKKPRMCDEEVGADGVIAFTEQDIRDLKLVIDYLGAGQPITQQLVRCKTALSDLLTSIHLVITSSVLVRHYDREPSLLQQLSSDNKTRALAKFAALQAQLLENFVAPNDDNTRTLTRYLLKVSRNRAATEPPVSHRRSPPRHRASPALHGRQLTPAPGCNSSSREASSPVQTRASPLISGRIRLSPDMTSVMPSSSPRETRAQVPPDGRGSRSQSPRRRRQTMPTLSPPAHAQKASQARSRSAALRQLEQQRGARGSVTPGRADAITSARGISRCSSNVGGFEDQAQRLLWMERAFSEPPVNHDLSLKTPGASGDHALGDAADITDAAGSAFRMSSPPERCYSRDTFSFRRGSLGGDSAGREGSADAPRRQRSRSQQLERMHKTGRGHHLSPISRLMATSSKPSDTVLVGSSFGDNVWERLNESFGRERQGGFGGGRERQGGCDEEHSLLPLSLASPTTSSHTRTNVIRSQGF